MSEGQGSEFPKETGASSETNGGEIGCWQLTEGGVANPHAEHLANQPLSAFIIHYQRLSAVIMHYQRGFGTLTRTL